MQQWGEKKSWIAFYIYGEILISTNQNLLSCKQISSFKPRVHRESTENGGSKQCRFIQWAIISAWCGVNKCSFKGGTSTATTRMFCSIFPNKWYFYTAPSDGNSRIAATSPHSTLESPQHSMVNIDSCHDYSYENTAKEPEQLFDKELFLEEVRKYLCLWDVSWPSYKERNTKANAWEKVAATFGKDGKIN